MALPLTSIALFTGVALISGALTVGGLNFTADTVAKVAAGTPVKARIKPSYVVRMPDAKPGKVDVAKAEPVKQVAIQAPVATAPAAVAPPVPKYTHKVAVNVARVRSGPRKSSPLVFTLKNGSWVNTTDTVQGWVRVTDQQGREGWVYGSLLAQGTPGNETVGAAE